MKYIFNSIHFQIYIKLNHFQIYIQLNTLSNICSIQYIFKYIFNSIHFQIYILFNTLSNIYSIQYIFIYIYIYSINSALQRVSGLSKSVGLIRGIRWMNNTKKENGGSTKCQCHT